ncbi:putative hemagglutinin [Neisseria flavescens]|nr:putative hemagglutinin [Neisseria meningitidis]SPY06519.1 putative hemagglutinin [Neisseria meningitidis]STZ64513.1 putative hemagglutinin [Neisseria flavescens]
MAAANAGWQAYQTGKGAQNLANGTTNVKQVSISIYYLRLKSRSLNAFGSLINVISPD